MQLSYDRPSNPFTFRLFTGMAIGAVIERDSPYDAVVFSSSKYPSSSSLPLAKLPEGSVVGTSSLRRVAQLKRAYPHLKVGMLIRHVC